MISDNDYSIEPSGKLTVIRLNRDLGLEEIFAVMRKVVETDVCDQRLWDLSKCFTFADEQVQALANFGKQLWPDPSKVGYVASNDLTYGLLRMFEVYREGEGYQTRVFRTEREALDWFEQDS